MKHLPPLPEDVLAALSRGETTEALKRLRAATGLGLQEAKYLLDLHRRQSGGLAEERAAGSAAIDELERREGPATPPSNLAPGEVPASNRWLWLLVAVVAACAVAYYVFLR